MKLELYETDYVLFYVNSGLFEFEQANYPYVYAIDTVQELLWEFGESDTDRSEVWIPTSELPESVKLSLVNLLINREREV